MVAGGVGWGLLNNSSSFSQNCNFLFLATFSIVPFHLVFVVVSKIKLIPDLSFNSIYCERPEI